MTAGPEGLERLLALEDIRMLRSRYCRYIDSHQFNLLVDVLSEDFVLDMTPVTKVLGHEIVPYIGRDTVLGFMNEFMVSQEKLVHITTNPIIEFQDGENAIGIWRQDTYVKEGRPDLPGTGVAYATVSDTYRKDDGQWRMTSVRVEIDVVV